MRPEDTLLPSEFDAVTALIKGMGYKEMAQELGVTIGTVSSALTKARLKAGKENNIGLAVWFVEKFPTEELRREGYIKSCLYLAQAMKIRSQKARGR